MKRKHHHFPWKLHNMLEQSETKGLGHIVSWLPAGTGFRVYNVELFQEKILPEYFKTASYKSFQRNLSWYRFSWIEDGPERGAYKHGLFVRWNLDLCLQMSRPSSTRSRSRTCINNKKRKQVPLKGNAASSVGSSRTSSVVQNRNVETDSFPSVAPAHWTSQQQEGDNVNPSNNHSTSQPSDHEQSYYNNTLVDIFKEKHHATLAWLLSDCRLSLDDVVDMLDPMEETSSVSTISGNPDALNEIKILFHMHPN